MTSTLAASAVAATLVLGSLTPHDAPDTRAFSLLMPQGKCWINPYPSPDDGSVLCVSSALEPGQGVALLPEGSRIESFVYIPEAVAGVLLPGESINHAGVSCTGRFDGGVVCANTHGGFEMGLSGVTTW